MKTLARSIDKADILARLANLRPESSARWGTLSAHEMLCHVNDSFRMATDRKPVTPATGLLQRTIIKWIALYAPIRWPTGIRTRPEVDPQRDGTKPGDFAEALAALPLLLERFATTPRLGDVLHPIFGKMSEAAWLRWGYLHADHHLRQFGL